MVLRALHTGFNWKAKGSPFSGVRHHRARSLDVLEAAQLAVAGGFVHSLSRVRLLYEISRRCSLPARHVTEEELVQARRILAEDLAAEIETLRRLMPPERVPSGIKGVPYPR